MRQLMLPSLVRPRGGARERDPAEARRTRLAALRRRAPRLLGRSLRPNRMVTRIAALAGFCLLAWAIARYTLLGAAASVAVLDWSRDAGLTVGEVLVEGRQETPANQVLAALDVQRGTPLFAFSPDLARERLLSLGWVKDARVERRLPDTIFVSIEERHPSAIWQNLGNFSLVDEAGAVIGGSDFARFGNLRVIVGDDAPAHFTELFRVLDAEPALATRVKAAVRVGGRRWNLQLDNGVMVLLPETGIAEAWARLADAAAAGALLDREIARIDLRSPDRLIVRLTPEAMATRRGQGA